MHVRRIDVSCSAGHIGAGCCTCVCRGRQKPWPITSRAARPCAPGGDSDPAVGARCRGQPAAHPPTRSGRELACMATSNFPFLAFAPAGEWAADCRHRRHNKLTALRCVHRRRGTSANRRELPNETDCTWAADHTIRRFRQMRNRWTPSDDNICRPEQAAASSCPASFILCGSHRTQCWIVLAVACTELAVNHAVKCTCRAGREF